VPVTAKLSKKFYDRLGEDIANELVEWFNLIDATYKSDLRSINEINFARFDARLEQRVESLRAELKAEIEKSAAGLRDVLERQIGEQTRWMFVVWSALLVSIIGLWFR